MSRLSGPLTNFLDPARRDYPPPPMSAPPTQTKFSYPTPPSANASRNYPPPPQAGSPTPPPKASTPSYPLPPQKQPQFSPPPQQNAQYGNLPLHLRTPSGLSQHSDQIDGEESPQFAAPPTYGDVPGVEEEEDGYPDEKQETLDTSNPSNLLSGAPPAGHFVGASATVDDIGTFNGGSYRISHRDCNTILTVQLAIGCPLGAKPGSQFSPTLQRAWRALYSERKFKLTKI